MLSRAWAFAPCLSSSCIAARLPWYAARCTGVMLLLSFASTSSPCSSNSRMMSGYPFHDVRCSGVWPRLFRTGNCAVLSCSCVAASCPWHGAKCCGVARSLSCASMSAPYSSKSRMMSVYPPDAVSCSAVRVTAKVLAHNTRLSSA